MRVHNTLNTQGSIVNMIRGTYMTNLTNTESFNLIMNKVIHMSSKNQEASGYGHNVGFVNRLALIA